MIRNATILSELPKSPWGEKGKISTADVYAIGMNKKRKRSELVTAIDGESINLYDVGNYIRVVDVLKG